MYVKCISECTEDLKQCEWPKNIVHSTSQPRDESTTNEFCQIQISNPALQDL